MWIKKQTLPDEASPIGKIHTFSKMAVTFEPVMQFRCPSGVRKVVCGLALRKADGER